MPITRNAAKHKMLQGEMALGFQVYHLRSIATPLLAAASGYDFLFIDTEHGAFSVQEATQICIAALPTGVAPLVRVCTGALRYSAILAPSASDNLRLANELFLASRTTRPQIQGLTAAPAKNRPS